MGPGPATCETSISLPPYIHTASLFLFLFPSSTLLELRVRKERGPARERVGVVVAVEMRWCVCWSWVEIRE